MTFGWPAVLWLYLLIPACVYSYIRILRRPPRERIAYPNLDLVAKAAAGGGWRRHVPPILYLATLCAVVFTIARPTMAVPVPSDQTIVMMCVDVSRSMMSTDVTPTRLDAAKAAAAEFVRALPSDARVGLVSFSSYATLVTAPTADHDAVTRAINGLQLQFATAIGDGLLEAVYALPGRPRPMRANGMYAPPPMSAQAAARLPPAVVVLLSDGQSNRGVPPEQAATVAKQLGVKVYTIGLGAPEGSFLELSGNNVFGQLDEETLMHIARVTGGSYQRVTTAGDLRRVYTNLGRVVGWQQRPTELTGVASAAVAGLFVGTLLCSLMWMHRLG